MSNLSAGLLERAQAAAQVVVADLAQPELSDNDQHHLTNVLRLRTGEIVIATDGEGGWVACEWTSSAELQISGDGRFEPRVSPRITVGFALTKGDKPELAVQKLTEVGVDVIWPIISERTIVKWDGPKAAANVERFRRVAYDASMQSRRVWLPKVEEVTAFSALEPEHRVMAQAGGAAISLDNPAVLVGPEGGWAPGELAGAAALVDLGPTILRAETAALAVGIHLCALRTATAQQKT